MFKHAWEKTFLEDRYLLVVVGMPVVIVNNTTQRIVELHLSRCVMVNHDVMLKQGAWPVAVDRVGKYAVIPTIQRVRHATLYSIQTDGL